VSKFAICISILEILPHVSIIHIPNLILGSVLQGAYLLTFRLHRHLNQKRPSQKSPYQTNGKQKILHQKNPKQKNRSQKKPHQKKQKSLKRKKQMLIQRGERRMEKKPLISEPAVYQVFVKRRVRIRSLHGGYRSVPF
jgi:hypothetical protein